MRFEFHPEAVREYGDAAAYYASKESALHLRFIASIERAIEIILQDPLRWPQVDEDIRRCLTRVFPYAIFYTLEDGYVLIVAVAHCSREPGYWKSRIS